MLQSYLQRIFSLDLRSLALLRISTGALLIFDLIHRAIYLSAHYTDAGVLPRYSFLEESAYFFTVSIHFMSGYIHVIALLFTVAGLAAFCLMIGWRTKWATILSWFMLLSLHNRNPFILNGGDELLLSLLFFGMFLPWGRYSGVEAATSENKLAFSPGTVAVILFIILFYFYSAAHKTGPEWSNEYTALYYSLSNFQYARPWASSLLAFPELLKGLTLSVVIWEYGAPLLLLIGWFVTPLRLIVVGGFLLLHLCIGLLFSIHLFPWVSGLLICGLLPAWFWDKLPGIKLQLKKFANLFPNREKQSSAFSKYAAWLILPLSLGLLMWSNQTRLNRSSTHLSALAELTGLRQSYTFFAPSPPISNTWPVIVGQLEDGTRIDLIRGGAVNWEQPASTTQLFRHARWHSYIFYTGYFAQRDKQLAAYLSRSSELPVKKLQIYIMRNKSLPQGGYSPTSKLLTGEYDCTTGIYTHHEQAELYE